MVVTEIIIKRIAFSESRFVFEIAAQRINRLEGKDVVRIFVRRLCGLLHRRFGSREYTGAGKDREKNFSALPANLFGLSLDPIRSMAYNSSSTRCEKKPSITPHASSSRKSRFVLW